MEDRIYFKVWKEVTVYYKGSENNTTDVANQMLAGDGNVMNGFSNEDGTKNVFIKIGEIAAASISCA